jgi:hypothetical protein
VTKCSPVANGPSEDIDAFITGIMKQDVSGKYHRFGDGVDRGMILNEPIGGGQEGVRTK